MFHLIPGPLHRLAYRAAHSVRKVWWQVAKPHLRSVAVVATDLDDRLLLVRLSYGSRSWSVPAGGIDHGETAEDAARREFREETGCETGRLELIGVQQEILYGAHDTIHVFATKVNSNPKADKREVLEARFFPMHSLPKPLGRLTKLRLEMWRKYLKQG